jgi:hypothetical protein
MRRPVSAAAVACFAGGIAWAVGAIGTVAAQENPMLGSWTATDPGTGMHEVLTVTPEDITFGDAAPAIPYRFEQDGDALALYLADAATPARFVFFDDENAQLSVPGGPAIALKRTAAPGPESQSAAAARPAARESVIDAAVAALLPQSASAPYDPLDPSLEGLLANGWRLDEVTTSTSGVTLLMRNGGHHAFCILVPRQPGEADGAASDCRRLN